MEGIVLYTLSYKEKSKLVYLYTPMGMKSVLVHHLKENVGFTTTFNIVNFEVGNGQLPVLINYDIIHSFYDFSQQLDKVSALMVMIQVIKNVGEEANHKRIYPFFKKCLTILYEKDCTAYILALFLTKMLAVLGIKPNFKSCVHCGSTDVVGFSVSEGGAVCRNCFTGDVNEDVLITFKNLYYDQNYDEQAYSLDEKVILKMLKDYYAIHAHIYLKNA